MNDLTKVEIEVESNRPIIMGLSRGGTPVGFMRITDKVEFSLNQIIWVDHDEGVCENGMDVRWDGAVVLL